MNGKTIISGVVNKIIFSENGFCIATIDIDGEFLPVSIKGLMEIEKEIKYDFSGEYKEEDKFGEYFQVYRYAREEIKGKEAILEYLTSKAFTGIGLRTANKIYTAFGDDAINVIKSNPDELKKIDLPEIVINELSFKISTADILNGFYEKLTPLNFSGYLINELYKYFITNKISNPLEKLFSNPFYYVDKIYSYSFKRADAIFMSQGGAVFDEYRISIALCSAISEACNKKGDTVINLKDVQYILENYLELEFDDFDTVLNSNLKKEFIYLIGDQVQERNFYEAEKAIATNVALRLNPLFNKSLKKVEKPFAPQLIEMKLNQLENDFQIKYSQTQKEAIINAINNNFSIITGGPGTGKTTIIKAIVIIYEFMTFGTEMPVDVTSKIMLCAPTGRAALRMKEATGFKARTIHSLLGWDHNTKEFTKNYNAPLTQELIIIDEFSMVDIFLAKSLFHAIKPNCKIIIVGDEGQLESISPGNVLGDFINSNTIPSSRLSQVFRQGNGSIIAKLAHQIDTNAKIELFSTKDMGIIEKKGAISKEVKDIMDMTKKAGYSDIDIQVLYPKYRGVSGIDNLNAVLKPEIDDSLSNMKINEVIYQVGDKIMQLKNDYNKEVFNGDVGFIKHIYNPEAKWRETAMEVVIRGKSMNYTREELEFITHAYAVSIHKAQGSEFKVVIVPITYESINMLTKKLIYTAISRAQEKLIIIGELDCFYNGVHNSDYKRKTNLITLLKEK